MEPAVKPVAVEEIGAWRDMYRLEMNHQIVHDTCMRPYSDRNLVSYRIKIWAS